MTDQKKFEELEKESLYAIMAESERLANVGGWEWDIKKDVWTFSDSWLHIHGCSDRHLTTEDLLPIAHPDDRSDIQLAFDNAVTKGEKYEIEHRIIRQDTGEVRYVQAYGSPKLDSNGKTVKLFGAAQDITERKVTERKVAENEERLRGLFSCIRDGIVTVGTDRFIVDCNPGFSQLFGYSMKEVSGLDMRKLYAEEEKYLELGRKLKEHSGDKPLIEIIDCIKKDGTVFTAEVTVFFMRDGDGIVTSHIGLVRDISDRIKAENVIKESDSKFKNYFETNPSATFVWQAVDDDFILTEVNNAANLLTDNRAANFIGLRAREIYKDMPMMVDHLSSCLAQKSMFEIEHYYKNRGTGTYDWINFRFAYAEPDLIMLYADNISEYKNAMADLEDSKKKYQDLYDNAPEMYVSVDVQTGNVIRCNQTLTNKLGYARDEIIGRPIFELYHQDCMDDVLVAFEEFRTSGEVRGKELQLRKKDGGKIDVSLNVSAVRDEDGEIIYSRSSWRDITERKLAEKKLKAFERMSHTWLEHSPVCTKIVDLDHNLQYMSSAGIKELCITDINEFYGKPYPLSFYPESFKTRMRNNLEHAIESGEIMVQEEPATDSSGNLLWYHSTIIPVKNNHGKVNYLMVVSVDTTARKLNEEKLRDSILQLDEAVRGGRIGLWSRDLLTNKVYYSKEWKRQIGYQDHEIQDDYSEWKSRVHPDDLQRTLAATEQSIKEVNNNHRAEFRFRHKDGSYRWILSQGSFITDELGQAVKILGSHIDITDQKKLQLELLQAHKIEAIGNLAGGIAHDFNNILTAMIGFTELSLDEVEKGSILEGNLQDVMTAGQRAKDLIAQILTFARQSEEEIKPISFDAIVNEVLQFVRSSITTNIEIKHTIESESRVMANHSQLYQIVLNLCTNAAQAMEHEGGVLQVTLKDTFVDKYLSKKHGFISGNYINLIVSDTGIGIPSNIIDSIFDPYFTTKGLGEGTGMGLAVVHGIIESYRGKITVSSVLGEGTTFNVYIPITKERKIIHTPESRQLPKGTERILFIDDEAALVNLAGRILEKLGYQVTTLTSSLEALDLYRSHPDDFDLVITDMAMPDMTGDTLAIEMMKIRPDIPVILWTGYSKKITEESVKKIGIKTLLNKPLVKAELAQTVREVLDHSTNH